MTISPRIIILDEMTINKIAAGEVVERPASVVKELVENAIDADARKITVEVAGGGTKLIRVSDDGCGMTGDEVKLSLMRHSTSKIKGENDLYSIKTLGFRGEALPSIASVSRLEISTKTGGEAGVILKAEGGKISIVKETGIPEGTTVIVKDLFFNTPARLKFLKSRSTELGHIGNIVSQFIFSHPEISFRLVTDGNELLSSPGSGSLSDSIASVYGNDLARNLIPVGFSLDPVSVKGFVTSPTVTRIDRGYESFFVNRRYVRNMLLLRSLEDVFRGLIPRGRHPVAIIFIELPAGEVDVNVHPTKREVKFVNTQKVLNAISSAVRAALSNDSQESRVESQESWRPATGDSRLQTDVFFKEIMEPLQGEIQGSKWTPLAQLLCTYIVATNGEALVLVDQHAAHERIIYDSLKGKNTFGSQSLLIPESIELPPLLALVLTDKMDIFKNYGFDMEHFGKDTFMIRALPAPISRVNPKEVLIDMLTEIGNLGKTAELEAIEEKMRALVACHGAIRAGDKLGPAEMQNLLKDLSFTENPATCPHGRPTMIELTKDELEKMFKRK